MAISEKERCKSWVLSSLALEYRCERKDGHEGQHRSSVKLRDRDERIDWSDEQERKFGGRVA